MKRLYIIIVLLASFLITDAQEISLDGQWLFRYAKDSETADSLTKAGFYEPRFKAEGFRQTPVPSCWAILGYEEPVYRTFPNDKGSEGLYVKRFTLPAEWKGKQLRLNFGGVWASAEIWLNGTWIGRHDSGYTSFAYSVTKEAKPGQENVLAVRVRQTYKDYKCDTYDDWSLGGIYRPVTIAAYPAKQWIDNVRTHTSFSDNYHRAEVNVTMMMGDGHRSTLPGNYRSPGEPYGLRVSLADANGDNVAEWQQTIPGHVATFRAVQAKLNVTNPKLWNAEHPYLYTLRVELIENGKVTHTDMRKIGLREITTTGGVLRINGVAVKLRGINRHDEWPDVGRATTREHWLKDLTMMKQANINYVRACHYQHAKGFIEMCDSIGMYVGAEVSLGGAGGLMKDPGFYPGLSTRIIETVNRDLDNPSIIYWSVGNEDSFNTMYYMAAKMVKSLDPTRPVLYPWNADSTLPNDIDILAPHYWTAHEYDSLAASSKRPIITTEFVHAYGTERFGGLDDCWNALTRHPAGAGGAVWMWADQGIKTPIKIDKTTFRNKVKDDYLRVSDAGWDGITDSYRNPTRDYWEVKAVYAPIRVDTATVTPSGGTATITLHNRYDFTQMSDFTQKWVLMVDGDIIDSGTAVVNAAPHSDGALSISTRKLKQLKSGQTAYVRVSTVNRDGYEISTGSVKLAIPIKTKNINVKPTVSEESDAVSITAGQHIYRFSRTTGSLSAVNKHGTTILKDLQPSVWHKLNEGDYIIKNRQIAKGLSLEKFEPRVLSMNIERSDNDVRITSKVEYFVNDSNRLTANYEFTVLHDGRLNVAYTIETNMQTTLLPLVGLSVTTAKSDCLKRWFGLGPDDAYPNKRTYPQLGLHDGKAAYGCKAVEWVETELNGQTVRLTANGYLVMDKGNSSVLRLAPFVLGRSEKGRLKDPAYILSSKGTYKGQLVID